MARFFSAIEFEDELADELADEGGDTDALDDGDVLKQSGDVVDKLLWLADVSSVEYESAIRGVSIPLHQPLKVSFL